MARVYKPIKLLLSLFFYLPPWPHGWRAYRSSSLGARLPRFHRPHGGPQPCSSVGWLRGWSRCYGAPPSLAACGLCSAGCAPRSIAARDMAEVRAALARLERCHLQTAVEHPRSRPDPGVAVAFSSASSELWALTHAQRQQLRRLISRAAAALSLKLGIRAARSCARQRRSKCVPSQAAAPRVPLGF